jgi:uncharacterized protein YndB with AHSA1/START domain
MPHDYTISAVIPASAREIYDAWLDSIAHSQMTGGQAHTSAELGAEFSAWDGYITGRNLELVPGERIVQSWRTTKFPEDHGDSIITVTLEEHGDGTLLTLSHNNVPDGHVGYERGGWQKSYFEPMIAYFSGEPWVGSQAEEEPKSQLEAAVERPPQRATQQPARLARPKRAAKKNAAAPKARSKSAVAKKASAPIAKAKRAAARKKSVAKKNAAAPKGRRKSAAARAKPKGAAPKAKKTAARRRVQPAVRAKARAKRARGPRRKSAGSRRR